MPFCPDCGTKVSEDTRFCPECGRPLAIGQAVKGKSKKKLAAIIGACIIVIIVVVVIATLPSRQIEWEGSVVSAQLTDSFMYIEVLYGNTYVAEMKADDPEHNVILVIGAEGVSWEEWDEIKDNVYLQFDDQQVELSQIRQPESSPPDESFVRLFFTVPRGVSEFKLVLGSYHPIMVRPDEAVLDAITDWTPEPEPTLEEPEPAIPTHFTTYTDELGLFSISYPPEWEPDLGVIEETEQAIEDIISSIASDLPVGEASLLFMAGLPTIIGHNPNVNIVVEPLSGIMLTHDEVVTAEIEGLKAVISDYHEFSRVKTTIDNRTATIIELQGTIAGFGTYRYVQMVFIVSKTVWVVTCTALPDEYSKWEDDFDAIVRSLRILK